MEQLSSLNQKLLKEVEKFPLYNWQIMDCFFKNSYDDYISSIKATSGRKITILSNSINDLRQQLKKFLLISDTITFNIKTYSDKPHLTAFPYEGILSNSNLRVLELTDISKRNSFIPNHDEIIQVYNTVALEAELLKDKNILLGYNFSNPDGSWQRSEFTLSSTIYKEKKKRECPTLVGFCYKYDDETYNFIQRECRQLLTNGYITFTPFLRSNLDISNLGEQVLKAGILDTSLLIENNETMNLGVESELLSGLQIPYLENISFDLFTKILKDEGQSLKEFRKLVTRSIEDIKDITDKESLKREIKYIKRNLLEDEFAKVEHLCNKVTKMRTFSRIGAVVATTAISLAAYYGLDLPNFILASSGPASFTIQELFKINSLKNELKVNPAYFLWKMDRVK